MKGLEGIAEENLKLDYVTPEVNNFGKWVNCIQLQPVRFFFTLVRSALTH